MLSTSIIRFHNKKLRHPVARYLLVVSFVLMVAISFIYQRWSERRMFLRRNYQTQFDLSTWIDSKLRACDGNFEAFGHEFVWLRNARISEITKVFEIPCWDEIPRYWFYRSYEDTPYTKWLADLNDFTNMRDLNRLNSELPEIKGYTFVVRRNEAHNLYHTMCEIYNIFLLKKIFKIDMVKAKVLFMDSRPPTILDQLWNTLFRTAIHQADIPNPTRFENLIWIPIGYESPLNFHALETVPFINEFHRYLKHEFEVKHTHDLQCKHINYTLILRHDYITNPEMRKSRKGRIYRKMVNEKEVIQTIENSLGVNSYLKTVELETFSIKEQVKLFSETDILIGVHGAGMTHILNLPDHAFVLELRPLQMFKTHGLHFGAMSRWRGLRYSFVTTTNETDNLLTYEVEIPLDKLALQVGAIQCILGEMCGVSSPGCH